MEVFILLISIPEFVVVILESFLGFFNSKIQQQQKNQISTTHKQFAEISQNM